MSKRSQLLLLITEIEVMIPIITHNLKVVDLGEVHQERKDGDVKDHLMD